MGVATGLIGLLPDYATAGFLGAALLITLRLIQGFSLGGEWGGAILTAALYLSLPLLLSADDLLSWGWRIPFLIAFPLLAVSLWLRFKIDETPVFTELVEQQQRARGPLAVVFRTKPVALILGVGAALLGIGSYSLMNTYTLNYGASQLGYDYTQLLTAATIGALLQLVTIPVFGAWANRIGSARVVLIGAIGTLVVAFPIYFLLQSASFEVLVGMMIVGGILPTMAWAALGGLLSELFGARIRYSAIAFAYAIAAIISGFVLATMSLITAVSAFFAGRRVEPIEALSYATCRPARKQSITTTCRWDARSYFSVPDAGSSRGASPAASAYTRSSSFAMSAFSSVRSSPMSPFSSSRRPRIAREFATATPTAAAMTVTRVAIVSRSTVGSIRQVCADPTRDAIDATRHGSARSKRRGAGARTQPRQSVEDSMTARTRY